MYEGTMEVVSAVITAVATTVSLSKNTATPTVINCLKFRNLRGVRILIEMPVKDGFSREQMQMICWEALIEKANAVRVIDALVDSLGMNQLGFESTGEAKTSRRAYDVSDLLKLYLYGDSSRIRSSRQLELSCVRNIEMICLPAGQAGLLKG